MIYPANLGKGSKIGVTAPSAGCESEADLNALDSAVRQFNKLGYPVIVTENVRNCVKGRSADGPVRARELKQLLEDREVRAIFAAHGGEFLAEMLSYVDFEALKSDPKWLQGYSDVTGLVFTVTTNLDIATIYGNNFSSFGMEPWHSSHSDNIKLLEGQDIVQNSFEFYQDGYLKKLTGLEEYELTKPVSWRNLYPDSEESQGELIIKGRAIGGCLDVLLNLVGTRFDKTTEFINKYKNDRILWFLESYDLGGEAMIRGLWQLKEAGWFQHAAGFIFGRPAMYRTFTDTDYDEAILSMLKELQVPIILEADIGHKPPQFAMVNGAIAEIRSMGGKGSIKFDRR
jgi:muramoyltetrapeptide carboxypeptidase LdcA involved in peptidoglycan recycling